MIFFVKFSFWKTKAWTLNDTGTNFTSGVHSITNYGSKKKVFKVCFTFCGTGLKKFGKGIKVKNCKFDRCLGVGHLGRRCKKMTERHLGRHKYLSIESTLSSKSLFVDLNVTMESTLKLSTLISPPKKIASFLILLPYPCSFILFLSLLLSFSLFFSFFSTSLQSISMSLVSYETINFLLISFF